MAGNFLIDFRGWYHQFVVGWNVFDYLVIHVEPQGILNLSDVLAETIVMELKRFMADIWMATYLIGITICSFHVGLDPSTVDVRSVFCLNVAVTNGRTFACR